mgnify:CR=1 FL=1
MQPEDAKEIKPVTLTFAVEYINTFSKAKAPPLSNIVSLSMSSELAIVVKYQIAEMSYINGRLYLASKIEDEEMNS